MSAYTGFTAEFTIEPFDEGQPGPHVLKAIEAAKSSGAEVVMGPFGSKASGTREEVVAAIAGALDVSLAEGASHVSIAVTNESLEGDPLANHPLFVAMAPILDAVGADVVPTQVLGGSDLPVEWEGELIGGIRLRSLEEAVPRMIEQIAREMNRDVDDLSRDEKQDVVRLLNERGALLIRGAVDEVADLLGVSRITVYNYLNASRREPAKGSSS